MNMIPNFRLAGSCLFGALLISGCESTQPRPVASRPRLQTTVTVAKPASATKPTDLPAKVDGGGNKASPDSIKGGDAPLAIKGDASTPIQTVGFAGADPTASLHPAAPARKSFVDITARSCFAHADDYSWVSGELQYSHVSRGWRLRYASVDEDDKWGGSVTLVCDSPSSQFKDGACVRVRGHIDESAGKQSAPPYQVESIQVIQKPDESHEN